MSRSSSQATEQQAPDLSPPHSPQPHGQQQQQQQQQQGGHNSSSPPLGSMGVCMPISHGRHDQAVAGAVAGNSGQPSQAHAPLQHGSSAAPRSPSLPSPLGPQASHSPSLPSPLGPQAAHSPSVSSPLGPQAPHSPALPSPLGPPSPLPAGTAPGSPVPGTPPGPEGPGAPPGLVQASHLRPTRLLNPGCMYTVHEGPRGDLHRPELRQRPRPVSAAAAVVAGGASSVSMTRGPDPDPEAWASGGAPEACSLPSPGVSSPAHLPASRGFGVYGATPGGRSGTSGSVGASSSAPATVPPPPAPAPPSRPSRPLASCLARPPRPPWCWTWWGPWMRTPSSARCPPGSKRSSG